MDRRLLLLLLLLLPKTLLCQLWQYISRLKLVPRSFPILSILCSPLNIIHIIIAKFIIKFTR